MNVLANPLNYTDEITINLSASAAAKLIEHIELDFPAIEDLGGIEMIELYKQLTVAVVVRRRNERKENK
tara:strand:- start:343 stop:549 length:207 start_codon:yes stop_codon:yes gene_type:complete